MLKGKKKPLESIDPEHHSLDEARVMLEGCDTLKAKMRLPLNDEIIMLSHVFFRNLSDREFIIVYNMPIQIGVADHTMKYIDDRRKRLKLRRPEA